MNLIELTSGKLSPLPKYPAEQRAANVPHAPVRIVPLNKKERAVMNFSQFTAF